MLPDDVRARRRPTGRHRQIPLRASRRPRLWLSENLRHHGNRAHRAGVGLGRLGGCDNLAEARKGSSSAIKVRGSKMKLWEALSSPEHGKNMLLVETSVVNNEVMKRKGNTAQQRGPARKRGKMSGRDVELVAYMAPSFRVSAAIRSLRLSFVELHSIPTNLDRLVKTSDRAFRFYLLSVLTT